MCFVCFLGKWLKLGKGDSWGVGDFVVFLWLGCFLLGILNVL